jgi:hypothetical protein
MSSFTPITPTRTMYTFKSSQIPPQRPKKAIIECNDCNCNDSCNDYSDLKESLRKRLFQLNPPYLKFPELDDERLHRSKPPSMIDPDMEFGLESVSCELADEFYKKHRNQLLHMPNRKNVTKLYIKSWKEWCPPHLLCAPRHVNQVLYAMAYYMRVCQISVDTIVWYTLPHIPDIPDGYSNQISLHSNVTLHRQVASDEFGGEMTLDELM